MSRKIEFDRNDILHKTTLVFWRQGFANTSMKDIERTTKLTPPSIYNSFGSKEGLFLATLDHYFEQVVKVRISEYLSPDKTFSLKKLKEFFYSVPKSQENLGCLLNMHITDGSLGKSIKNKIDSALDSIERAMLTKVKQGVTEKVFVSKMSSSQIADLLYVTYQGVLALDRKVGSNSQIKRKIDSVFKAIER